MKLVYLAERENMRRYTATMTGDDYVSMQNGPVLSSLLRVMNQENGFRSELWDEHARLSKKKDGEYPSNTVVLKDHLDTTKYLSKSELTILDRIWELYKDKTKWELVDLTHEFPEWDKTTKQTKSMSPIKLYQIFHDGLGESEEVAKLKADDIEYYEAM